MKIILVFVRWIVVLAVLAVLIAFVLPRRYRVERSTTIAAQPELVFAKVGDLKLWPTWSVWHERDPGMKVNFSEPSGGVGAWTTWESKSEGNGKMTFTAIEPAKRVAYTLEFVDMHMVSTGSLALQPENGGVRVLWVSEGELGMNPIMRWMGLLFDRLIGRDFESGLAKLKRISEATK